MNPLQDPVFFIVVSYAVSALLVAAEVAVLWRRSRAGRGQDRSRAPEEGP